MKLASGYSSSDEATIEWLLEEDNPCIRYLTLTKLLGQSGREKGPKEARNRIPDWTPVKKMLSRQKRNGGWDEGTSWYHPKYKSTIWQLIILSQVGISTRLPEISRMCDYALRFQTLSGGFVSDLGAEAHEEWGHRAGCLNGNVIAALCRLGLSRDKRIGLAVEHLLSIQEQDGGWGCRSFGNHMRDKHSCFMGAICALDGLNEYATSSQRSALKSAIENACEFLLMHRLFRADHHDWRVIKRDWTFLRAPYMVGYDVLRGLLALENAGWLNDARAEDALELLMSKRTQNGRWNRETHWPSNTYSSFGKLGTEDKWVTLNALRVLKSAHRIKLNPEA